MAEHDASEILDLEFKRPESYVVSLRLNAEESRALTIEAKRAGQKLSTFIKSVALEAVSRRQIGRSGQPLLSAGGDHIAIRVSLGFGGGETTWAKYPDEVRGEPYPSTNVA